MKQIWESICLMFLLCAVIYLFSNSKEGCEHFIGRQVGETVKHLTNGYQEGVRDERK